MKSAGAWGTFRESVLLILVPGSSFLVLEAPSEPETHRRPSIKEGSGAFARIRDWGELVKWCVVKRLRGRFFLRLAGCWVRSCAQSRLATRAWGYRSSEAFEMLEEDTWCATAGASGKCGGRSVEKEGIGWWAARGVCFRCEAGYYDHPERSICRRGDVFCCAAAPPPTADLHRDLRKGIGFWVVAGAEDLEEFG
jgi:hypothetical protein